MLTSSDTLKTHCKERKRQHLFPVRKREEGFFVLFCLISLEHRACWWIDSETEAQQLYI